MLDHLRCSSALFANLGHDHVGAPQDEVLRLFFLVVVVQSRRWPLLPALALQDEPVLVEQVFAPSGVPVKVDGVRCLVMREHLHVVLDRDESILMRRTFRHLFIVEARLLILHQLDEAGLLSAEVARPAL